MGLLHPIQPHRFESQAYAAERQKDTVDNDFRPYNRCYGEPAGAVDQPYLGGTPQGTTGYPVSPVCIVSVPSSSAFLSSSPFIPSSPWTPSVHSSLSSSGKHNLQILLNTRKGQHHRTTAEGIPNKTPSPRMSSQGWKTVLVKILPKKRYPNRINIRASIAFQYTVLGSAGLQQRIDWNNKKQRMGR